MIRGHDSERVYKTLRGCSQQFCSSVINFVGNKYIVSKNEVGKHADSSLAPIDEIIT